MIVTRSPESKDEKKMECGEDGGGGEDGMSLEKVETNLEKDDQPTSFLFEERTIAVRTWFWIGTGIAVDMELGNALDEFIDRNVDIPISSRPREFLFSSATVSSATVSSATVSSATTYSGLSTLPNFTIEVFDDYGRLKNEMIVRRGDGALVGTISGTPTGDSRIVNDTKLRTALPQDLVRRLPFEIVPNLYLVTRDSSLDERRMVHFIPLHMSSTPYADIKQAITSRWIFNNRDNHTNSLRDFNVSITGITLSVHFSGTERFLAAREEFFADPLSQAREVYLFHGSSDAAAIHSLMCGDADGRFGKRRLWGSGFYLSPNPTAAAHYALKNTFALKLRKSTPVVRSFVMFRAVIANDVVGVRHEWRQSMSRAANVKYADVFTNGNPPLHPVDIYAIPKPERHLLPICRIDFTLERHGRWY